LVFDTVAACSAEEVRCASALRRREIAGEPGVYRTDARGVVKVSPEFAHSLRAAVRDAIRRQGLAAITVFEEARATAWIEELRERGLLAPAEAR
jgi:hypothetical protein